MTTKITDITSQIKLCYDGRTCGNEALIEDLLEILAVATSALQQYADGKTWRHIATDALEEIERRGLTP